MTQGSGHVSVLLQEAVEALQVQAGRWYIDGTFGRGGHTAEILKAGGNVIAFDWDQTAIEFGQAKFKKEIELGTLILIRENFEKIGKEVRSLTSEDIKGKVWGVLLDFGVSSPQLDQAQRGFSFQDDAELDMRMDERLGVKAKDLLAVLSEKQLAELFWQYGGEPESRKIAKVIAQTRTTQPIQRVPELVSLIAKVKRVPRGHLHPATKVFQALRIAVNQELDNIHSVLPQALELLQPGGRVVTISFHEGEDRIVKTLFKNWQTEGKGQHLTKDVITPSEQEVQQNSRARSAKLRIFEKNTTGTEK